MVKVVDLKNRAIERLEAYRDNPRALPSLTYARYLPKASLPRHKQKRQLFAVRKHKQHQMHAQHRINCVQVLQWLIKRLDVRTRQCVFVNPARNIRRTIYIPEIARHIGIDERSVTRIMDSLTRSRYVLRTVVGKSNQRYHYYLTELLFRDIQLDISLRIITGKLKGLDKKAQREEAGNTKPAPAPAPAAAKAPKPHIPEPPPRVPEPDPPPEPPPQRSQSARDKAMKEMPFRLRNR